MRRILVISVTTLCLSSAALTSKSSERDLILDSVQKLQPALNHTSAKQLADSVREVVSEPGCNVSWPILLSVAFHESSFRKDVVGKLNPHTVDYGLMQINEKTRLRLGLNTRKLLSDERYSLRAACFILSENKERFSKKVPYWIGIYRSGTALWKKDIRATAVAYNRTILGTARKLGYRIQDRRLASY